MTNFDVLDNPAWLALTTAHESLARCNGLARRYSRDVSPFVAVQAPTPDAFSDLRELVAPEETVGLCSSESLPIPVNWQLARTRQIDQMVCTQLNQCSLLSPFELGPPDVPEMLALTAATEPGPFLNATIQMGRYFGIRTKHGRLIAMAGERLKLAGFTEISAVCTDPEFQGQGYSRALVTFLAARILAEEKIPFLHVKSENGAKSLYESIGFRVRRPVHLTVITRASLVSNPEPSAK